MCSSHVRFLLSIFSRGEGRGVIINFESSAPVSVKIRRQKAKIGPIFIHLTFVFFDNSQLRKYEICEQIQIYSLNL